MHILGVGFLCSHFPLLAYTLDMQLPKKKKPFDFHVGISRWLSPLYLQNLTVCLDYKFHFISPFFWKLLYQAETFYIERKGAFTVWISLKLHHPEPKYCLENLSQDLFIQNFTVNLKYFLPSFMIGPMGTEIRVSTASGNVGSCKL